MHERKGRRINVGRMQVGTLSDVALSNDQNVTPLPRNQGAAQSANRFISPPAWRYDATLDEIYGYIHEYHYGDTDGIYEHWYQHAVRHRKKPDVGVVANGWHKSWNSVRVAAPDFGGDWKQALHKHCETHINRLLGIPRAQPHKVERTKRKRVVVVTVVPSTSSRSNIAPVDGDIDMTPTEHNPLQPQQSELATMRLQFSAIIRGINQTNTLLTELCKRLPPLPSSPT